MIILILLLSLVMTEFWFVRVKASDLAGMESRIIQKRFSGDPLSREENIVFNLIAVMFCVALVGFASSIYKVLFG